MILKNAKPRLKEAIEKANNTKEKQPVDFIYNELFTHDGIWSVFKWLFEQNVDFETKHSINRFNIIIAP